MNRKQVWLVVVVALVAGWVGGSVSSLLFTDRQALAQDGEGVANAITTGALRLAGADGQVRAEFDLTDDGEPRLRFYDQEGNIRAGMYVSGEGLGSVYLADKEMNPRAILSVSPEGTPSLTLFDQNGQPRAALGADEEGLSLIHISEPTRPY